MAFGWQLATNENPYVAVLRSYLNIYVLHAGESMHISRAIELLGGELHDYAFSAQGAALLTSVGTLAFSAGSRRRAIAN